MTIDFPLILVIIVFGSGGIWLLDSLFLAGGRRSRREQLTRKFPGHEQPGSEAAVAYAEACDREAAEPAVVEYARSFFSCSGRRIGVALFFIRAVSDPIFLYGANLGGGRLYFG